MHRRGVPRNEGKVPCLLFDQAKLQGAQRLLYDPRIPCEGLARVVTRLQQSICEFPVHQRRESFLFHLPFMPVVVVIIVIVTIVIIVIVIIMPGGRGPISARTYIRD